MTSIVLEATGVRPPCRHRHLEQAGTLGQHTERTNRGKSTPATRTRAAMMAQVEQQIAKINALDQQIAQKRAEADGNAAAIAELEAGLPLLQETADVRHKAMKIEYGNRIAHLEAQLRRSDQRNELIVQQRRAPKIMAARQALEAQREQTRAEYARGIIGDLAEVLSAFDSRPP